MIETTLDHIHFRGTDPEAAANFYIDNLNASLVAKAPYPLGPGTRFQLQIGSLTLMLDPVVDAGTKMGAPAGIDHISFRVGDLDETLALMKARGVTVEREAYSPREGLKIAFIRGPDDLRVELMQRG
ncbi:VOC family protein [Sinorhizobium medicae]|uniref:VOC family protein n=1 Tax=Sinorhizobium medicae TaxID=110321 RepID=UPI0013E291DC|nr:VOC family protein [Sinorhizobium medicae]